MVGGENQKFSHKSMVHTVYAVSKLINLKWEFKCLLGYEASILFSGEHFKKVGVQNVLVYCNILFSGEHF